MDLKTKHEKLLYPVVRVFAEGAAGTSAGSGTIIYSRGDPKNEGEFFTFVLTNHHVIDGLIKLKESWDSVLKKNRRQEFMKRAKVEIFDYVRMSNMDASKRYTAEVIAYSQPQDLAVLKLDSPREVEFVAPLLPKDKIKDLKLYMEIEVSGCSMAHEPFSNPGRLTFLNEDIENKKYFMINGASIFGNSGGALFLADESNMPEHYGSLIGVPSRISSVQLGFGVDIITWMGFSAHTDRIYEFFEEQHLDFLFDSEKTYYDAIEAREEAEKKSMLELQAQALEEMQRI